MQGVANGRAAVLQYHLPRAHPPLPAGGLHLHYTNLKEDEEPEEAGPPAREARAGVQRAEDSEGRLSRAIVS